MSAQKVFRNKPAVFLRVFASSLLPCRCASPLLAERTDYTAGVLAGIHGVYDNLAAETTNRPPAVCLIDMRHPDTVREAMKKPAGQGHLAYLDKMRARIPELSSLRCVAIHYTQLTADDPPKTNFKALLINALDKGINHDYREQLYRIVRQAQDARALRHAVPSRAIRRQARRWEGDPAKFLHHHRCP